MGRTRESVLLLVASLLVVSLAVTPGVAKFRDAINFEDNQFVDISKVEVFHSYTVVSGETPERFDGSFLEYQVTSGLMSFFELGARLPVKFYDNGTEGAGNLSVFQRFKFQEATGSIPASSGGIELILPTGEETSTPPTGTDDFNARLFGTMGHSLQPNWIWLVNGGVTFFGGQGIEDKWEYNASLRYQPGANVKVMFEGLGQTGGLQDDTEFYFAPGISFLAESGFNMMLSAPVGVTSDAADFKPTVQFAHEF